MRILLADDEYEIRNVLRLLLENKGHEILEAHVLLFPTVAMATNT